MTQELHPTAIAYQQAERRHRNSVTKEAAERAALKVAREARDQAIRDDPDLNHAAVGRRFAVSSTWVKKVRGQSKEDGQ